MRKFLIILALVIIAAVPRLIFLNTYPDGFNIDELDYVLNAKSVFLNHTDVSHEWKPLSLTTLPGEEAKGELTTVLMAPFLGPLPLSLLIAKLPFALAGIGTVVLIYLISKKLFGIRAGIASGLVVALNPLAIFWSRTAVDTPLSIFFFLLALTILIYGKRWWIILSVIPLFLSFYTYIGSKLIFLPFVLSCAIYCWIVVKKRQYTKQYLIVIVAAILIFLNFIVRFSHLPANDRVGTIFSPNHQIVSQQVDGERRLSLETPVSGIFSNKLVVYLKMLVDRYVGATASPMLFSNGDSWHFWFLWGHGFFYYVDAIFIFIGIFELISKRRREAIFLFLLSFSGTLPTMLNGVSTSYVNRSYLYLLVLMIVAGLGIAKIYGQVEAKIKKRNIFIGLVSLTYLISVSYFLYAYFIRSPINQQSQYDFPFRILARYVSEESKNGKQIVMVTSNPRYAFQQYIVFGGPYNELGNKNISDRIAKRFKEKNYEWNGTLFTDNCSDLDNPGDKTLIVSETVDCSHHLINFSGPDHMGIERLSDSGEQFKILQGNFCSHFLLNGFANRIFFNDLNVEKLSNQRFCQQFITGPPPPPKI